MIVVQNSYMINLKNENNIIKQNFQNFGSIISNYDFFHPSIFFT